MFNEKILLATADSESAQHLTEIIRTRFEDNYIVKVVRSCADIKGEIEQTDLNGDDISLVIIDENLPAESGKMPGYHGLSLIKERNKRTPVIFLTSMGELDIAIQALNPRVNLYMKKPLNHDYLLAACTMLLDGYKKTTPKSIRVDDNTIIKTAETAFEYKIWGQLRYKVYVEEEKLIRRQKLKAEFHEKKEEWDEFDRLPSTKQIIALRYEEIDGRLQPLCIAGSRQMFGVTAMDKIFYLNDYRKKGIVPRQVCRFIVERSERGRKTLVMEFIRYLFDIFRDDPITFCTSRDHQISLFEKMGFIVIGNAVESEQYGLDGKWTPMVFDPASIWQSFLDGSQEEKYPNLNQLMFNAIISPILSPCDHIVMGDVARSFAPGFRESNLYR